MTLPFDENLAPRLAGALADVYPGSVHVHQCGLGSADDKAIWQYAKDNDFTIVSKDSDFQERSVLQGYPPKVIWLRATNCTSAEIESLCARQRPSSPDSSKKTQSRAWFWGLVSRPSRSRFLTEAHGKAWLRASYYRAR